MAGTAATEVGVDAEGIENTIRSMLDELGILTAAAELDANVDLYDAGMTSHASVKFMLALENSFDLEFPDDMLKRETFSSIGVISAAIRQLRGCA